MANYAVAALILLSIILIGLLLLRPSITAAPGGKILAFLAFFFRFADLPASELATCLGAGVLSVFWFEIVKFARTQRRGKIYSLAAAEP